MASALIDVQQLIPLPEAEDFQVRLREKVQEARRAKGGSLTEERLLQHLRERCGEGAAKVAKELLDWITPQVDYIIWGKGHKNPGAIAICSSGRVKYYVIRIGSRGGVVFLLDRLHRKPPFDQPDVLGELRLNQQPEIQVSTENLRCRPKVPLAQLSTPDSMRQLKETVEWLIGQVPAATKK